MATKKTNFESSIARLEEIVRRLDSENGGLEESLKLYEEGIALVRECNKALESAEQKMKTLSLQANGTLALSDDDSSKEEET